MENFIKIEALKLAQKGNIVTEGIITDLVEGKTKRNDPYISAKLSEKDASIELKVWSEVYDKFVSCFDTSSVRVYQVSGVLEEFEGKKQINVKSILAVEKDLKNYTVNTVFPPEKMLDVIKGYTANMQSPTLKVYMEDFISHYEDELMYFPYSSIVHSEKGGLLAHLYNCVSRAVKYCGDPKKSDGTKKLNTEIVVCSICMNSIENLKTLQVDRLTGSVSDRNNIELKAQFGSAYCYTCILPVLCSSVKRTGINTPLEDAATVAMLHCVLATNGVVTANSLEAIITKNIIHSELEEQALCKATNGLLPGETTQAVFLDGSKRTVFLS